MSHVVRTGNPVKKLGKPVRGRGLNVHALADYLRQKHRHCVAGYVAARTGIPNATVSDWLMGRCGPSTRSLLTLISVYGPALLEACWPDAPAEFRFASQVAEMALLKAEIAAREERLAALESRAT